MERTDKILLAAVLVIIAVAAVVMLSGCAKLGIDNTASGGGSWAVETYHPCYPPECKPIGGNAGNVGNATTRGGNVDADAP